MALVITVQGNGMRRFEEALMDLGTEKRAHRAFVRAVNRTGKTTGNEAGRTLSNQTGLPKSTGRKAHSRNVERASPAHLAYTIDGSGGDISLKHCKPRDTRKSVIASPWGKRQLYPSSFMKAG